MTAAELEKVYALRHYRDLAGQANLERREAQRRKPVFGPTAPDRRALICGCGNPLVEVPDHGWACPLILEWGASEYRA